MLYLGEYSDNAVHETENYSAVHCPFVFVVAPRWGLPSREQASHGRAEIPLPSSSRRPGQVAVEIQEGLPDLSEQDSHPGLYLLPEDKVEVQREVQRGLCVPPGTFQKERRKRESTWGNWEREEVE